MSGAKKTEFASRMDEVQKLIDPDLKELGFKKSRRIYNRSFEPGIVQVIQFQMGPYEPPLPYVSPVPEWLKPDLYGQFAVNLGIYVEEVAQVVSPPKQRKIIAEVFCTLRIRLGRLINLDGKEYWWNLAASAEEAADNVRSALLTDGIAFLERFSTREAIISDWVHFNEKDFQTTSRARLDVGIILAAAGKKDQAAAIIKEHLAQSRENRSHNEYVLNLAKKLGIDLGE